MSISTPAGRPLAALRVDASMRREGSVTRRLADRLIARLQAEGVVGAVDRLDLAQTPAGYVDEAWIGANFTAPEARDEAQRAALAPSDALVERLKAADVLVLAAPMYNFGPPAALKAWIDQIARAGVTFRYGEAGPVGLLEDKKAYIVTATGGAPVESAVDYAIPYLRHVLGFIGVTDVTVVAADQLNLSDRGLGAAEARIDALELAALATA